MEFVFSHIRVFFLAKSEFPLQLVAYMWQGITWCIGSSLKLTDILEFVSSHFSSFLLARSVSFSISSLHFAGRHSVHSNQRWHVVAVFMHSNQKWCDEAISMHSNQKWHDVGLPISMHGNQKLYDVAIFRHSNQSGMI